MTATAPHGPPAKKPSKNRKKLLDAARELIARQGYAGTGTEQIVRHAGITRGALYYQFHDKRDLFRAVCEDMLRRVSLRLWGETMRRATQVEDELALGCNLLLDYYSEPEIRQILLLDGPAVLGWDEWRKIQQPVTLGLLIHGLEHQAAAGRIPEEQIEPLAHLLFGALAQAGVAIANARDPKRARETYRRGLDSLLNGFGASADPQPVDPDYS